MEENNDSQNTPGKKRRPRILRDKGVRQTPDPETQHGENGRSNYFSTDVRPNPRRKPNWKSRAAADPNDPDAPVRKPALQRKKKKRRKPNPNLYEGLKGGENIIQNKINRRRKRQNPPEPNFEADTRLNKYISNAGVCSRRDADKLIESGAISINGEVVTTLGVRVRPGDVVTYEGKVLQSEAKRYFLLNKPKDYITTVDDPQERDTVMMLMEGCCKERIYPVGRLDRATTGLLLFTNDGELSRKLSHPSSNVYKVYQVETDHPVSRYDMQQMLDGIELEDGFITVDDVQYVKDADNRCIVGVALHSGKNRIVRRIFEHLGYEVVKLDRTVYAGLTKKDLPRGRYRELSQREVNYLMMI